jgi:hypothetical protein
MHYHVSMIKGNKLEEVESHQSKEDAISSLDQHQAENESCGINCRRDSGYVLVVEDIDCYYVVSSHR